MRRGTTHSIFGMNAAMIVASASSMPQLLQSAAVVSADILTGGNRTFNSPSLSTAVLTVHARPRYVTPAPTSSESPCTSPFGIQSDSRPPPTVSSTNLMVRLVRWRLRVQHRSDTFRIRCGFIGHTQWVGALGVPAQVQGNAHTLRSTGFWLGGVNVCSMSCWCVCMLHSHGRP